MRQEGRPRRSSEQHPEAALTLARAPVGGVPVVARDTGLAVPARGQVLTLLTDALVHTLAVPVTLTGWGKQENCEYWCPNVANRDPQESVLCREQMKPFHAPSQEVLVSCYQFMDPKTGVHQKMKFKATHGNPNCKTLCAHWTGSWWWEWIYKEQGGECCFCVKNIS